MFLFWPRSDTWRCWAYWFNVPHTHIHTHTYMYNTCTIRINLHYKNVFCISNITILQWKSISFHVINLYHLEFTRIYNIFSTNTLLSVFFKFKIGGGFKKEVYIIFKGEILVFAMHIWFAFVYEKNADIKVLMLISVIVIQKRSYKGTIVRLNRCFFMLQMFQSHL